MGCDWFWDCKRLLLAMIYNGRRRAETLEVAEWERLVSRLTTDQHRGAE